MSTRRRLLIRALYGSVIVSAVAAIFILESIQYVFRTATEPAPIENPEPFPISVNPLAKRIEANMLVEEYHAGYLALRGEGAPGKTSSVTDSWLARLASVFAPQGWYQQLASPVGRVFVIWPGERKEEVAKHIQGVLRWDTAQTEEFLALVTTTEPALEEGTFYPDSYVTHRRATPTDIATLISNKFQSEIGVRYTDELELMVPLEEAIIIASLLEREASDFTNMREVSGVIWNRRFIDMPLQLDATLQYVRGSYPGESSWWPAAKPADKRLDSAYNTYRNQGLPPAPIANVSAEAVLAALNPIATDCLFYFHGPNRAYYCSATYEEHKRKLREVY